MRRNASKAAIDAASTAVWKATNTYLRACRRANRAANLKQSNASELLQKSKEKFDDMMKKYSRALELCGPLA